MGRVCIKDHRPEHSLDHAGQTTWRNGCAQCEVEALRALLVRQQAVASNLAYEQALFSLRALADDCSEEGQSDRASLLRACAATVEARVREAQGAWVPAAERLCI